MGEWEYENGTWSIQSRYSQLAVGSILILWKRSRDWILRRMNST